MKSSLDQLLETAKDFQSSHNKRLKEEVVKKLKEDFDMPDEDEGTEIPKTDDMPVGDEPTDMDDMEGGDETDDMDMELDDDISDLDAELDDDEMEDGEIDMDDMEGGEEDLDIEDSETDVDMDIDSEDDEDMEAGASYEDMMESAEYVDLTQLSESQLIGMIDKFNENTQFDVITEDYHNETDMSDEADDLEGGGDEDFMDDLELDEILEAMKMSEADMEEGSHMNEEDEDCEECEDDDDDEPDEDLDEENISHQAGRGMTRNSKGMKQSYPELQRPALREAFENQKKLIKLAKQLRAENKQLKESEKKAASGIKELETILEQVMLDSTGIAYLTDIKQTYSLTENELRGVSKKLDECQSLEELNEVYSVIKETVEGKQKKNSEQLIESTSNKGGTTTSSTLSGSYKTKTAFESEPKTGIARMLELANIKK